MGGVKLLLAIQLTLDAFVLEVYVQIGKGDLILTLCLLG
jgi:hypothetical protein